MFYGYFHEHHRSFLSHAAPHTLLVLPLGSVEQHGPHLPVGTDLMLAERIAHAAGREASQHIPVMLGTAVPFGTAEEHLQFGATLSLRPAHYRALLSDLITSYLCCGFANIVMLNGHKGNEAALTDAMDGWRVGNCRIEWFSYWDVLEGEALHGYGLTASWVPGHAGAFETALANHLLPSLIAHERLEQSEREDSRTFSFSFSDNEGYTDRPQYAERISGSRLYDEICQRVARRFVAGYTYTSS